QDCLCYMEYRGKPVKASRLFAGNEHEKQVKRIAAHFNVSPDYYKSVQYNPDCIGTLTGNQYQETSNVGNSAMVQESSFGKREPSAFATYEVAYHQLMADLMVQQVAS